MENLQQLIDALIELEKQYPNNYELGAKVRTFINENLKQG
jgi:hypothetical protein